MEQAVDIPSDLRNALPNWNLTVFQDKITGILAIRSNTLIYSDDYKDLRLFLDSRNAYAALPGFTSRFFLIPMLCKLGRQYLRVGKILCAKYDIRLFKPGDDYSDFLIIDLFRRAFRSVYKNDEVGFYITPPFMRLIRYDDEHQTNLHEILYSYITSGCNMTHTAEDLNIHRNTLSHQLKKIAEITEADLSNPDVQFKFLLSFKILYYFETCSKLPREIKAAAVPGDSLIYW